MFYSSDQIKQAAQNLFSKTQSRRRYMHQNPELSFQEKETSLWIQHQLTELGIPWTAEYTNYGIRAEINRGPGPVITLRADFDALPIHELNDIPYKSTNPGVMHACGHDAHTSILLSTLELLQSLPQWQGTVRAIFQPAEEKNPGGAKDLIAQGVLDNPCSTLILGEHINPGMPIGTVGFRPGLMMASADEIQLTIKGKGGHAASPHLTIDPIAVAAQIIVALQQVVSRKANPETPSVVSFGRIIGEGAMNVIPDQVFLAGTFRTVHETWRNEALDLIQTIAEQTAAMYGAQCDVFIDRGYPCVRNHEALTHQSKQAAQEYLGKDNVIDLPLTMWAEDFAYYAQEVPGCFYFLGVGPKDGSITSPLHSPTLTIDEQALEIGVGLMAWITLGHLEQR
jgi:amidohydrolase